jgi:hypothetical protein
MNDANLKPFTKDNQPNNPGRKKSVLKEYIKDANLSATDITLAAKSLLGKSYNELKKMATDKTIPMVIALYIKAMLKDWDNGNLINLDKMLDRIIGKPTVAIDLKAKHDIMTVDISFTPEEEAAYQKRLAEFMREDCEEKENQK